MKIGFKNLGILDSGTLFLKPLTILCGANNTGKTYAMYMLYGLLSKIRTSIASASVPDIGSLAKQLIGESRCEIDAIEFYKKHASKITSEIAQKFNDTLDGFFNSDKSYFSETQIDISIEEDMENSFEAIRAASFNRRSSLRPRQGEPLVARVSKLAGGDTITFTLVGERGDGDLKLVSSFIRRQLMRLFFYPESAQVFLLPAERSGINIFQRELVAKRTALFHPNALARHATQEDIEKLVARYPQPIADYIDFLNILDLYESDEGEFSHLAKILEQDVLGGKYIIQDGDITFLPNDNEAAISLHLASSTVKTYFGLWFYLQHIAAKGDWFMVDEPELSLHPDNQRKVARVLSRLIDAGVNVVISTHSDYIVREFNNMIMLNDDFEGRDDLLSKFNYQKEELISPDVIGAYNFADRTMCAMEIDRNEGIIAKTFDDVINKLNKSSNEIYYSRRNALNAIADHAENSEGDE